MKFTAKLNKLTTKGPPEAHKKVENAEATAVDGQPIHHMQPGPH